MYDDLPDAVMDAHIDRWMDDQLPAGRAVVSLGLTLNETRTANGSVLRDFWTKFSPVLSAWVSASGTASTAEVRQAWIDPETTRDACVARARDGGCPTFLTHELLRDGRLVRILDGWEPEGYTIYAVYPSRQFLTPKVRTFIDFLIDRFGDSPYWDKQLV